MTQISNDPRTYAIIGAAQEVHTTLGCGYLERVYQLALANEFRRRAIPFEPEVELPVTYKGDELDCSYRVDFLCYGEVLVELKALEQTGGIEASQVINYLKTSGLEIGLLLNFGRTRLDFQRYCMSNDGRKAASVVSASSADG